MPEAAAVKRTLPSGFESSSVTGAGVNVTECREFLTAKLDGSAHRHKQVGAEMTNRILELPFMNFTAQPPSLSSVVHKNTARPLTGVGIIVDACMHPRLGKPGNFIVRRFN